MANGQPLKDSHLDYLASKLYGGTITDDINNAIARKGSLSIG